MQVYARVCSIFLVGCMLLYFNIYAYFVFSSIFIFFIIIIFFPERIATPHL